MQKTTGDKFRKHFSLNATGLFSGALLLAWCVGCA
ncbi:putative membrane protein, partial [Escherichia coli 6-319-05_S1_C1]